MDGKKIGFFTNRVLPSVYSDEIAYYEELNKLCYKLNELIDKFNSMTETYVSLEELNASQEEQDKKWSESLLKSYNELLDYTKGEIIRLEKLISDIIAGQVTAFDPTYGILPRPIDKVIKNVYHWLRYYGEYAGTIDNLNLTAQQRDEKNLNAKTFDLYSINYYSELEPQPYN